MSDVVSGYLSTIDDQLPLIVERLRSVQFVCRPAIDVIRAWDSPETLHDCDPPYLPTTRHESSREVYGCEMSEEDHCELADVIKSCTGKVILSGYPSELYSDLYRDWRTMQFDRANHAAGGKSKARKKETLWLNW